MDGKNASGQSVSLLNSSDEPANPQHDQTPYMGSRSGYSFPATLGRDSPPPLSRTQSSDSNLPSPLTPHFSHGTLAPYGYEAPPKASESAYPPYPLLNTGPLPYPHLEYLQPLPVPPATRAKPSQARYPCPLAKEYRCPSTFTTSGHASRHSKVHTHKKDAICPDCGKAFTRKDNMNQHRRTHQNGRNVLRASDNGVQRVKQQGRRPKPSPIQSSPGMASLENAITLTSFDEVQAPQVPPADHTAAQYPDPGGYSNNYAHHNREAAGGLDALATAAATQIKEDPSLRNAP